MEFTPPPLAAAPELTTASSWSQESGATCCSGVSWLSSFVLTRVSAFVLLRNVKDFINAELLAQLYSAGDQNALMDESRSRCSGEMKCCGRPRSERSAGPHRRHLPLHHLHSAAAAGRKTRGCTPGGGGSRR
ncbi:hypothetical protein QQF64_014252 [Cirrhinus molitorella]|uniref:Uncharacterized protein n=1 Tax=Cirrhinus molitorella TaxID=172907 RepID=A0ABR3NS15_9TELE